MDVTSDIDAFLARALRGQGQSWPAAWNDEPHKERLIDRAHYHGIASLITRQATDWPDDLKGRLHAHRLKRVGWELRHRHLLQAVLRELSKVGIKGIFLKGTALAYHAYREPSFRERADSDLLVRPNDSEKARKALAIAGLSKPTGGTNDSDLQETWRATISGTNHAIDLHFASFNSQFLAPILSVEECFSQAADLPRLDANAMMLGSAQLLLHVCIHRNMHRTAPYFSGGKAFFSSDRLIWANDIALLCEGFDDAKWQEFTSLVRAKSVSRAMVEALDFAQGTIGLRVPAFVHSELSRPEGDDIRSTYLLDAGRQSRLIKNIIASPGWRQRLIHEEGTRALTWFFESALSPMGRHASLGTSGETTFRFSYRPAKLIQRNRSLF